MRGWFESLSVFLCLWMGLGGWINEKYRHLAIRSIAYVDVVVGSVGGRLAHPLRHFSLYEKPLTRGRQGTVEKVLKIVLRPFSR